MKRVAVLISTYNGEKFLKEQLDSVLSQRGVQVEIFVRDDCSHDSTREILESYVSSHDNFHVEFASNVGVGNSFMNLVYSAPSGFDYYAFCDQDDVWLENKLLLATEMLESEGKALYASNQECVDSEGNSLGLRYGEDSEIHLTPVGILEKNTLAGCTMVFSEELCEILKDTDKRPSEELLRNRIHDVWAAMVASLCGGIVYDSRSFMRYRQHGGNVVGAYEGGAGERLKKQAKKFFGKKGRNGRSMLAREIVERFPEAAEYPLIEICANIKTFKGKRGILKHSKELRSYTKESGLGFWLKVMLGYF